MQENIRIVVDNNGNRTELELESSKGQAIKCRFALPDSPEGIAKAIVFEEGSAKRRFAQIVCTNQGAMLSCVSIAGGLVEFNIDAGREPFVVVRGLSNGYCDLHRYTLTGRTLVREEVAIHVDWTSMGVRGAPAKQLKPYMKAIEALRQRIRDQEVGDKAYYAFPPAAARLVGAYRRNPHHKHFYVLDKGGEAFVFNLSSGQLIAREVEWTPIESRLQLRDVLLTEAQLIELRNSLALKGKTLASCNLTVEQPTK